MSFDEEHIDPHGECAHEISRLTADLAKLQAENGGLRHELAAIQALFNVAIQQRDELAYSLQAAQAENARLKPLLELQREKIGAQESELKAAREAYEHIGWIQEIGGTRCFSKGALDPREIHDNGQPCYKVFRAKRE